MSSSRKIKIRRKCAVLGCGSSDLTLPKKKFFSFPSVNRNAEKRQLWIEAVCRQNSDGTPWIPKKYDEICNDHFTSGQHSQSRYDKDYVPHIFPSCDKDVQYIEYHPQARFDADAPSIGVNFNTNDQTIDFESLLLREVEQPFVGAAVSDTENNSVDKSDVSHVEKSDLKSSLVLDYGYYDKSECIPSTGLYRS